MCRQVRCVSLLELMPAGYAYINIFVYTYIHI